MNPTRKSKVEDLEAARQARIRQINMLPADRIKQKLIDLQTFIRQLARTDEGQADLRRRAQIFGDCKPLPDESDWRVYGKLRHWLDSDLRDSDLRDNDLREKDQLAQIKPQRTE